MINTDTDTYTTQSLRDGKSRITELTWAKGPTESWDQGQVCALTALPNNVAFDVVLTLQKALPKPFSMVQTYNDDPNTTLQDIHDLFDRAIEIATAEENS